MKKLSTIAIIGLLFLVVSSVKAEEPVVLKFAHHNPPQIPIMVTAYIPWIEAINKAAQGAIRVDLYPGAILGRDPRTYLKLLNDGVQDITYIQCRYYPGRFPDDEVFNMPFMARNAEEASLACWNIYIRGLLVGYDDLKVLVKNTTDVNRIHTTFPVRTPKDLKGHRICTAGKLQAEFFKSVGAIPVSIPIQDVAENMTRGVIDGVLCDTAALYVFRIHEAATHYLKTPPLGVSSSAVIMTQKKFDSLPRRGKMALEMYRGRPLIYPVADVMWRDSDKCIADAEKDPKHSVYTPTPEEMQEWKKAMQPIVDKWKKEHPKGEMLIAAFQRELDWIRAGGFGIAQ